MQPLAMQPVIAEESDVDDFDKETYRKRTNSAHQQSNSPKKVDTLSETKRNSIGERL